MDQDALQRRYELRLDDLKLTYEARLAKLYLIVDPIKRDKKKILKALQKGSILLDAPLKSVREIIDYRPPMHELDVIGERFVQNDLEPIDNISKLKGLKLKIFVNFQNPDEVLSNRDDLLYVEKLKETNTKGITEFVIEGEGHGLPHPHLWDLQRKTL